jgi:hypothetical protein
MLGARPFPKIGVLTQVPLILYAKCHALWCMQSIVATVKAYATAGGFFRPRLGSLQETWIFRITDRLSYNRWTLSLADVIYSYSIIVKVEQIKSRQIDRFLLVADEPNSQSTRSVSRCSKVQSAKGRRGVDWGEGLLLTSKEFGLSPWYIFFQMFSLQMCISSITMCFIAKINSTINLLYCKVSGEEKWLPNRAYTICFQCRRRVNSMKGNFPGFPIQISSMQS